MADLIPDARRFWQAVGRLLYEPGENETPMGYDVSGLEQDARATGSGSGGAEYGRAVRQLPHGTADEKTPIHYRGAGSLQPFDIIDAFGLGFYDGNVCKYVLRYKLTSHREDLEKARHYLDEFIKRESADSL